jgi:DNA-binding NarL/FixJ family response regulator
MTQERPYRPAHTPEQAAAQLERDAHEGRLDPEAASAVLDAAGHPARRLQRTRAAGLTGREVEVLRLAARGRSVREIGRLLSISPKTADHHIQHIYTKIGVSTRAGAAIFAMEHDLIPIEQPGEIG